jgi:hypothetical protein
VQHAVAVADHQPPVTGAVADGVDGQLMHRKNDVPGTGLRRTGVGGVGGHGCPQRKQRPVIEILDQNLGAVRARHVWPSDLRRVCSGIVLRELRWAGIIGH